MPNRIWISWSFQRRSRELAEAFSAEYHHFGDRYLGRVRRYFRCIPKTLRLIGDQKPSALFVQNPSLILATLAALLKSIYHYTLVIDLHTPYITLNRLFDFLFWKLQAYCVSRSDLTLVTNDNMKALFPREGIMVLPDKLPHFENPGRRELEGDFSVVFVCTFSEDEPYEEVGKAARLVGDGVHIYVTGRFRRVGWAPEEMPPNVHLTGFLSEEAYVELLNSADAVMILTSQPDCLVCGAYESVSLNKPMILSNEEALRRYFSRGAVYVDNAAESIAAGIAAVIPDVERLSHDVAVLRETLEKDWREKFEVIAARLDSISPGA
ncbi:MAG TPA: glycosyltransferase [Patescibacteria group bacterium]|nr:glycosyltransferase [Patescibacteria group bacterium]